MATEDGTTVSQQRFAKDGSLWLVLLLSVVAGLVLFLLLPPGFALPIVADYWRLAAFVVFYPLLEEYVFRGFIQSELLLTRMGQKRLAMMTFANGLTSVLFVLLHFVHQPPLWALAVFVPSLALGYFRERYGAVWPCVLLHAWFNGVYLVAGSIGSW